MKVTAKLNNLRIAPRKVRLVVDLIREKKVPQAQSILMFTVKRGSEPILKLLNSAIANAKHNFHLSQDNLYISKITVDEGPKMKRWMPRARGSAYEIQKKTSHVTIVLDEIESGAKREEITSEERTGRENSGDKAAVKKSKKERSGKILRLQKPKVEKTSQKVFRRKAF